MSNQVQNREINRSHAVLVGNSPTLKNRIVTQQLDTIDKYKSESQSEKEGLTFDRVVLPKAAPTKGNYLDELITALQKVYSSMAEGAQSQADRFAEVQDVTQALSQAVFISTNDAIAKQKKNIELEKNVYEAQQSGDNISHIFTALQVIGTILTIAIGFIDGGVTDALIPEELGAIAESEAGAAEVEESVGTALEEEMMSDTMTSQMAEKETIESTTEGGNVNESVETSQTSKQEKSIAKLEENVKDKKADAADGEKPAEPLKKKTLPRVLAKIYQMTLSATFSLPMLFQGLSQIKQAEVLAELAQAQRDTGGAMAAVELNKQYATFFQQVMQRSGAVAQQEVEQLTNVLDLSSKSMQAVRQISMGLAQAI